MEPKGMTTKHDERLLRYGLAAVGVIALIGAIYFEEDWRGKRTWKKLKAQIEAQGGHVDWTNYVPAAVPDEQNVFGVPEMKKWFVGRGACDLSSRLEAARDVFLRQEAAGKVAEVTVVKRDAKVAAGVADVVLDYSPKSSATAKEQLENALTKAIEGVTNDYHGERATTVMGAMLTPGQAPQVKPVRIVVRADRKLETNEVAALFPSIPIGSYGFRSGLRAQAASGSDNDFEVQMDIPPIVGAANYLRWSDGFAADFDLIREALKRPCSVMPGDYQSPVAIPIPNFVCVRIVAQTLADRAKCHLLTGQPEEALKDMALVRGLCRMLEGRPNKSSATLVATMINAAVTALYTDTIAEGMRLKAWREPELADLQRQLKEIDLPPLLVTSFEFERAAHSKLLENVKADEFEKLLSGGGTKAFGDRIKDPVYLFMEAGPHGWVYQNLITMAKMEGEVLDGFDEKNRMISSSKVDHAYEDIVADMQRLKPYNYLTTILMPNFTRAVQTLARNQCGVDEALIACGLERYRLSHGEYPKSPDALVPQYLDKLPTDIISGEQLKYRVKPDGQFLLYSVGWNQKDDGGVAGPKKDGTTDVKLGDWVWGN